MTAPRGPGPAVPFILAACTAVSVLSTDVITPSIPDLPGTFGTTIAAAQMTVSVNLAAYAVAQLVHGPVADAIGRRRLLIVAFLAFAGFSVFCALARSMDWLLYGRFLQGAVSSVPSVVIILIIRELYDPKRALSVMALYGAVLGLAPALGPLIGGYLHVWYGWQAPFWFIAAVALVVVALLWRLVPESLAEPRPLKLGRAMAAYGRLLATPAYLAPTVGVSLLFSAFYAYVTTAPVVFIDLIGLRTERYGLTNLAIVSAFIVGNLAASRLSRRFDAPALLRGAALVMSGAMLFLLLSTAAGVVAVVPILAAMMVYGACLALVLAAGPLVVLGRAGDAPQGPAAALLGSLQLGFSSAAGMLSARFYDGTPVPMAAVMTGVVLLGLLLVRGGAAAAPGCRARPEV